ncbi:POTRA domain-containing protein [Phorcysia thermohydrogeniphila]|uniref:Surface antigen-like variable number repeat protein n=1 Tax=Phorcysia thermohydrogeniphila TaxID=936138 RepID=A0A4R1GHU2_9BACT|nr:POTRA domain-containing protein [Phorcysia thermohydrogeniphila]TCK05429.1 surface antigen-like variable number repeat protein [Phorcysia thermohydrogeniphila]
MKKLIIFLLAVLFPLSGYGKTVSKIEIVGLKWTKKALVRKELLIHEGEEFSKEKLKKSIRNLLNTHLFYKVVPEIKEVDGKVVIKLRFKERFPIVPIPRVRLKADGTYKAGMEVRDYNLFGMGHRLYVGYTRWFGTDNHWKNAFIYTKLYRIIENDIDLNAGISWAKGEDIEYVEDNKVLGKYNLRMVSIPISLTSYLDPEKVKQIIVGIRPTFSHYSEFVSDRRFYYLTFGLVFDRTSDMVYYIKGSRAYIYGEVAEPTTSSVFTGALFFHWENNIHVNYVDTYSCSFSAGTKVGYSEGFFVNSGIPGYKSEKTINKRFLRWNFSLKKAIVGKSVFLRPNLTVGDAFKSRPDDLLIAPGFELTAFWAKLADGIISLKFSKGIGKGSDTQTNFRFDFRW